MEMPSIFGCHNVANYTAGMKSKSKGTQRDPVSKGMASERPFWLIWLPAIIGFSLYVNTLTHDFALDDAIVITENMFTQEGISGIPGLLKYDTFYGFFKEEGKAQLVAGGRYRPLTPIMFAFEKTIFGGGPFMSHLISALLYGLLCFLLFYVLRQLTGPRFGEAGGFWIAWVAAMVFAVHPLHTEAVANVKGRDEIMTLLFSMLAWWAALRAYDEKKSKWTLIGGVFIFLGLMSKEHAISFLAVIPASLWFFREKSGIRDWLQYWPLLLAGVLFLIIRGQVIGWQMGHTPQEMLNNPFIKVIDGKYLPFTNVEKWGTIFVTLFLYLKLLVWPWPLTHDYYPRHIEVADLSSPLAIAGLVVHIFLVILVVMGWKKRSLPAFCALFYLATLSLMSNILFPVGTHMSERFLFMPSLGFGLVAGYFFHRGSTRYSRTILLGLLALILVAYGSLTFVRNPVWKDNYTLFMTDAAISQRSAKLQNACGGEILAQAVKIEDEASRDQMVRRGIGHLEKALSIHPAYKNACLLMGNAYYYLREYLVAIEWYERAIRLDPAYVDALNNLHIALRDGGRYFGETRGDLPTAMLLLKKAEKMKPDEFETLRLLGVAHGVTGRHEEAIAYFKRALAQQPENADIMVNIGAAYMNMGNAAEGKTWHEKAMAIDPDIFNKDKKQ